METDGGRGMSNFSLEDGARKTLAEEVIPKEFFLFFLER